MYDDLIAELRQYNNDGTEELRRQAADAIEELQSKNSELLNDFDNYSEYCKAKIEELSEQLENETEYATALNSYVPQWIPVTERLPEAAERVLCYCRANIYEVLKMRTSGDWFYDVHHIYMHEFVTHWMPLPKPPDHIREAKEMVEKGSEP